MQLPRRDREVERECQEEAVILRACADELSDEQRRQACGERP